MSVGCAHLRSERTARQAGEARAEAVRRSAEREGGRVSSSEGFSRVRERALSRNGKGRARTEGTVRNPRPICIRGAGVARYRRSGLEASRSSFTSYQNELPLRYFYPGHRCFAAGEKCRDPIK